MAGGRASRQPPRPSLCLFPPTPFALNGCPSPTDFRKCEFEWCIEKANLTKGKTTVFAFHCLAMLSLPIPVPSSAQFGLITLPLNSRHSRVQMGPFPCLLIALPIDRLAKRPIHLRQNANDQTLVPADPPNISPNISFTISFGTSQIKCK